MPSVSSLQNWVTAPRCPAAALAAAGRENLVRESVLTVYTWPPNSAGADGVGKAMGSFMHGSREASRNHLCQVLVHRSS